MEIEELAALVDVYTRRRERRLEADKVAKEFKRLENEIKEAIISECYKSGMKFVGGATHKVTLQTKEKPMVNDWHALYSYIYENEAWELLQRRLHEGAVKERFGLNDVVPGIEFYEVNDLSVSKV